MEKSKIRELLKVAQEAENWKMLSENLNENLNLKINGDHYWKGPQSVA